MTINATFKVTACNPQDATRHHAVNISQVDGDKVLPSPVFDRQGKQENKVQGVVALVQRAIECAEAQDEKVNLTLIAGEGVSLTDLEHQARVATDDALIVLASAAHKATESNGHVIVIA